MKQDNFRAVLKTCNKCGNKYMIAHQTAECPHPRVVDTPEFKAAFEAKTMSKQDELTPGEIAGICGKFSRPENRNQGLHLLAEMAGEAQLAKSKRLRLDRPELREIQCLWCQHCKALQKTNDTVVECWYNPLDDEKKDAFCAANEDACKTILALIPDEEEIRKQGWEDGYQKGQQHSIGTDVRLVEETKDSYESQLELLRDKLTVLKSEVLKLNKKLDDREADLIEAKREERERIKIPINMALTMFDEMLAKSEPKMPYGARAVRTRLEQAIKEEK